MREGPPFVGVSYEHDLSLRCGCLRCLAYEAAMHLRYEIALLRFREHVTWTTG